MGGSGEGGGGEDLGRCSFEGLLRDMLQLEVMSKKMGNALRSRLGSETRRGNMFGSICLGGSFFVAGMVLWQHEAAHSFLAAAVLFCEHAKNKGPSSFPMASVVLWQHEAHF